MSRWSLLVLLCFLFPAVSFADTRIDPQWSVPEEIAHVLETAKGELGYSEGPHGYTKYGEWAGDPYAQWCAEFLCWCVNETDLKYGTHLLESQYPMYSSSNVGKNWFIEHGRYIVRWGNLEGWGYQWLKGQHEFLTTGSYIPQPGDWVFFTWTSDLNTDHVAMVEYCTRASDGSVTIHCIEGNTPNSVKRAQYALTYKRILGFGTVHDAADWTMRSGNSGEKVRQLQTKLAKIGYLDSDRIDGKFGPTTQASVMAFQRDHQLNPNGIATMSMQSLLDSLYRAAVNEDPETWLVEEDTSDDFLDLDSLFAFPEPEEEDEISMSFASPGESVPVLEEEQDGIELDLSDAAPDWVDMNE